MPIKTHVIQIEDCFGAVDREHKWITPRHPSNAILAEYQCVQQHGGHTILSGHAGDIVFGNVLQDGAAVLAPLLTGRLVQTISTARDWAKASRRTVWSVIAEAVAQIAPRPLLIRHSIQRARLDQGPLTARGVTAMAAERFFLHRYLVPFWLEEIERRSDRIRALGAPENARMLGTLCSLVEDGSFQSPSEFPGIAVTYPCLHRPLLSFAVSLPAGVLCSPGLPRALMKEAFGPLLPASVRKRFSKGRLSDRVRRQLIKDAAARYRGNVHAMQLAQHNFIDVDAVENELKRVEVHGVQRLRNFPELLRLESWLVASQNRPARASAGAIACVAAS